jgi:hypothetical protein
MTIKTPKKHDDLTDPKGLDTGSTPEGSKPKGRINYPDPHQLVGPSDHDEYTRTIDEMREHGAKESGRQDTSVEAYPDALLDEELLNKLTSNIDAFEGKLDAAEKRIPTYLRNKTPLSHNTALVLKKIQEIRSKTPTLPQNGGISLIRFAELCREVNDLNGAVVKELGNFMASGFRSYRGQDGKVVSHPLYADFIYCDLFEGFKDILQPSLEIARPNLEANGYAAETVEIANLQQLYLDAKKRLNLPEDNGDENSAHTVSQNGNEVTVKKISEAGSEGQEDENAAIGAVPKSAKEEAGRLKGFLMMNRPPLDLEEKTEEVYVDTDMVKTCIGNFETGFKTILSGISGAENLIGMLLKPMKDSVESAMADEGFYSSHDFDNEISAIATFLFEWQHEIEVDSKKSNNKLWLKTVCLFEESFGCDLLAVDQTSKESSTGRRLSFNNFVIYAGADLDALIAEDEEPKIKRTVQKETRIFRKLLLGAVAFVAGAAALHVVDCNPSDPTDPIPQSEQIDQDALLDADGGLDAEDFVEIGAADLEALDDDLVEIGAEDLEELTEPDWEYMLEQPESQPPSPAVASELQLVQEADTASPTTIWGAVAGYRDSNPDAAAKTTLQISNEILASSPEVIDYVISRVRNNDNWYSQVSWLLGAYGYEIPVGAMTFADIEKMHDAGQVTHSNFEILEQQFAACAMTEADIAAMVRGYTG